MKWRAAGFTLIEMLIVMAILAIAAATIGPRLWGQQEPNPARDIPRQLSDLVDKMRSDAIFQGKGQAATIDFEANQLIPRDSDHGWTPPSGWQLQPDDGSGPAPTPAGDDAGNRLPLEFMPDGTARQARFAIVGPDGHAGWSISISPMTGRTTLTPLDAADASRS